MARLARLWALFLIVLVDCSGPNPEVVLLSPSDNSFASFPVEIAYDVRMGADANF
ncbi:hypothetical protein T484DRAFT_1845682 [Baffinella frigidus]|nr:hypothetical protein T484DRAFT_1845682 [Cryptophyta sp. CCMP2293]